MNINLNKNFFNKLVNSIHPFSIYFKIKKGKGFAFPLK